MTMNTGVYGNYNGDNYNYQHQGAYEAYTNYNQYGNHGGVVEMGQYNASEPINYQCYTNYTQNCTKMNESYYKLEQKTVAGEYYDERTSPKLKNNYDATNIITSDNGLSYTNLDTYNTLYQPKIQDCMKSERVSISRIDNWSDEQYSLSSNTEFESLNLHYMKDDSQCELWTSSSNPIDMYQQQSVGHVRHGRIQQSVMSGSNNKAVPTYKWMQVKRNVPKPNGKFLCCYIVDVLENRVSLCRVGAVILTPHFPALLRNSKYVFTILSKYEIVR